ncbi:methyl-CpG-binding protein 2-like isoform X2 [Rhodamnia argentea]|uniref:Methyl-CpG-binding protein 2-like isoform X2 n=1 Tax=Rhodamnia argentea TaxID=178133 RepID=A0A8B8PYV0_9MYRT|nr:methyl-CpG-binding protein 2-like isoform X2 [Rhodamnia argentea]
MDEYYCRKSGQIPAFGDWDHANELPITQYFECARQPGLLRFSSSSGESDRARKSGDLYAVAAADEHKFSRSMAPHRKARTREKRNVQLKEQRKTGRVVCEMKEPPRKQHLLSQSQLNAHSHHHHHLELPMKLKPSKPKAVDEDLYKIPPHLLHTTKRKKVLGFFSRCLVPACTA